MPEDYRYEVFSNSLSCFDYERPVPDDYAIAVGDSFTWGYTPLKYKWTTKLEQLSGHFLLKCGVSGYGTKQELAKLKKVAKVAGKPPKYIIVLYSPNDLNDDFLFPLFTVYEGFRGTWVKNFNLDTGEVKRLSKEELAEKYRDYFRESRKRKIKEGLVIYRVYLKARQAVENALDPQTKPRTPRSVSLPRGLIEEKFYKMPLIAYLDEYSRPWFNKAIKEHEANLIGFIHYADSVNAKLLFIDMKGQLLHERFSAFRNKFDNSHFFYYNLDMDNHPNYSHWPNDGHWDINGNQEVGKALYKYVDTIHFFQ